jgi:hypothetical protein
MPIYDQITKNTIFVFYLYKGRINGYPFNLKICFYWFFSALFIVELYKSDNLLYESSVIQNGLNMQIKNPNLEENDKIVKIYKISCVV